MQYIMDAKCKQNNREKTEIHIFICDYKEQTQLCIDKVQFVICYHNDEILGILANRESNLITNTLTCIPKINYYKE